MIDWYIEVSDGVKRKTPPEIIKASQLTDWQKNHQKSTRGLFSSIYLYPTNDPYVGGVISPFYADFDDAENPDRARKEAVSVVKKFVNDYGIPKEHIHLAFSGRKGVSLTIDHQIFNAESSVHLPLVWKSVCQELIGTLGLKTLDTAIYERRRLWRLVNSQHQKSRLYKIPVTLEELESLTIERIREMAKDPRALPEIVIKEIRLTSKAEELFERHKIKVEQWLEERKKSFKRSEMGSFMDDPPCVKRRLENGAKAGLRNISLFQLAVYYAIKGLSESEILKIGYEFAERCEQEPEPFPIGNEVESIVNSARAGVKDNRYSVGCSSTALLDLCDRDNCPFFNPDAKMWMEVGEPITFEEWRKTIRKNFPHYWLYAEACASTIAVLLIEDAQPVALVLQGVPGSGKTTTLNFFKGFIYSHSTDKFTPRSFVSHMARKKPEELEKIDLLPRIKNKALISPDLNTIFGAKRDELAETFSLLTRVLDGQGLTIDSGVYGTRGYSGEHMFTWIGATTPIPHKVWDLFGNLGARMYFMHVPKKFKSKKDRIKDLTEKPYKTKLRDCNFATLRFLKGFWKTQIEWDRQSDHKGIVEKIIDLAEVLVRLRGRVRVAVKEGYNGAKTFYSTPVIEEPERAIEALYALARGHALIKGRTQLKGDDLPIVCDVALSSAPNERVITFAYLLQHKGKATTQEIMKDLKCSRPTAIRRMKTLEVLELVDLERKTLETGGGEQEGYTITLKKEYEWFTTAEFQKLWRLKITNIIETQEISEEKEEKEPLELKPFESMFSGIKMTLRPMSLEDLNPDDEYV